MMTRRYGFNFFLVLILSSTFLSCGVKGKPLPPLEPVEIGRGAPTYKRAAEASKPQTVPTPAPGR